MRKQRAGFLVGGKWWFATEAQALAKARAIWQASGHFVAVVQVPVPR